MTSRLTPYAVHSLRLARELAAACESEAGPEHLLLSLLDNRDNMASRIIALLGIQPGCLAREVERLVAAGGPGAPGLPGILELALDEARRLRDRRLGTDHLLLALARAESSAAARLLDHRGLDLEALRLGVAHFRPAGGLLRAFSHAAGDSPPVSPEPAPACRASPASRALPRLLALQE